MNHNIWNQSHLDKVTRLDLGEYEVGVFSMPSPVSGSVNEDSMAYLQMSDSEFVLMVADGAGGYPKGEEASLLILNTLVEGLGGGHQAGSASQVRNLILDAIERANQSLLESANGSKTTVTIGHFFQGRLRSYQVGDSGLLVCGQKGKLKFKTLFHSAVGYGVESGLINEEEALEDPDLNIVSNILGDKEMSIDLGPVLELDDRDTILLATDGIFDNLTSDALTELIRAGDLMEVCENMVHYIRDRMSVDPGGQDTKYDDYTFMLCRRKLKGVLE